MTPVRRVLTERRVAVGGLATVLVLNILAYVVVVRPLQRQSFGAAARAAAAAAAAVEARTELDVARALVAGKEQADKELSAFYQDVLPADLTAARRMTYASLPSIARRAGVQYEARTTTIDAPDPDGTLARMGIRMVVQGSYGSLRTFIYELERAKDFVIIDDVTLTESLASEPLMLTVNLSTYYRAESRDR